MRAVIALILLLSSAAPGLAAAQDDAQTIDDLLNQLTPDTGVFVTDPTIDPDGPPTSEDRAYEGRVLGAYRDAQTAQGPLDGGWQVRSAAGEALYDLQIADPGAGPARVEGAWRNPRLSGLTATGFIDSVTSDDGQTTITFREREGGPLTRIRVRAQGRDRWTGEAGGKPIVMIRAGGVDAQALGAAAPQLH